MILDKYFIVNKNENAEKLNGQENLWPLIGVLDKWEDKEEVPENQKLDPNFTTVMGGCFVKKNEADKSSDTEGIDWKNIKKGGTNAECRHMCNLDEKCSAYEYTGSEMWCRHWYGDIDGNGREGSSCYLKIRPIIEPLEPESSGAAGTVVAIILIILLLGGGGVFVKFYGK